MNGRKKSEEASAINVSPSIRRQDCNTSTTSVHAGFLQKITYLDSIIFKAQIQGYVWNASTPKSVFNEKEKKHLPSKRHGNTWSDKMR